MADAGSVTVVVVTRNRCERLRSCLSGLLELPEQPEVIVVDNASTDNTETMVRLRFPAVQLVRLEANAGGLARNIGTQQARTTAVAFAEEGSGWAPGSLDRANRLIHRHPRLAVVAGPTRIGANGFSRTGAARAAVLRRDALLSVGGFPGAARHVAAEVGLARRLARAGWRLAYCVDVVAWCDSAPRAGLVVAAGQ